MNEITISDALDALRSRNIQFSYMGAPDLLITRPVSIEKLCDGGIGFLRSGTLKQYERLLTPRNVVIVRYDINKNIEADVNLIFVNAPEIAFFAIAALFVPLSVPMIDPSAVISQHARIGDNVSIGALTYIGPLVEIAEGTIIGEGCVINNCSIGRSTVIQAGVKLGSDALGVRKDDSGQWHDRPHFASLLIGSNVRIEDNVVINRGYLTDTIVSDNVRIGPQTWVGSAVFLDGGVLVAQSVTIAGSVSIGKHAAVWGNAAIRDGVTLGDNCIVGMGSVVLKSLPANVVAVGNPARILRSVQDGADAESGTSSDNEKK